MSPIDHHALAGLVTDALERTAFVIADPCEDAPAGAAPGELHARIAYDGPASGELFLSANPAFLVELAASIMGVDEDDVAPDAEGLDALRELANIVGGSALAAIGGEDSPYALGLPEIIPGPPAPAPSDVACTFETLDGRLIVRYRPAGPAAAAA